MRRTRVVLRAKISCSTVCGCNALEPLGLGGHTQHGPTVSTNQFLSNNKCFKLYAMYVSLAPPAFSFLDTDNFCSKMCTQRALLSFQSPALAPPQTRRPRPLGSSSLASHVRSRNSKSVPATRDWHRMLYCGKGSARWNGMTVLRVWRPECEHARHLQAFVLRGSFVSRRAECSNMPLGEQ